MKQKGFTLIELLVVISIIGLLASVVLVALNGARSKGRDARRQADFHQLSIALNLYYSKHTSMPANYNPGFGACQGSGFYEHTMQDMINDGELSSIPKDPGNGQYCYYDYGSASGVGALLVTNLESIADTTTGAPPSCRPWASGANWCDQDNDKEYCLCVLY